MSISFLNTREQASLILLAIALGWCLTQPAIRRSLGHVLQVFFQWRLLLVNSLMLAYATASCIALHTYGLWEFRHITLTVVWFIGTAFAQVLTSAQNAGSRPPLRGFIKNQLRAIILVEFLVNMFTLPLLVELLVQPLIVFISLVEAVAGLKLETKSAQHLANALLGCLGFGVILYASIRLIQSSHAIDGWKIMQDFLTPLGLSFLFLPFLYLITVIMVYERLFIPLKVNMDNRQLLRYTKLRMFRRFGVDHRQLATVTPQGMWEMSRANSRSEVEVKLAQIA